MGLSNMAPATELVAGTQGQLFVQGLSLKAISLVIQGKLDVAARLYDQYAVQVGEAASEDGIAGMDLLSLAKDMCQEAPDIAARIIAVADSEFDIEYPNIEQLQANVKVVLRLPLPVQLDALEKIAKLTFVDDMSPKKVVEIVMGVVQGATAGLVQAKRSAASSLASAGK